jgi:hypothetical protein
MPVFMTTPLSMPGKGLGAVKISTLYYTTNVAGTWNTANPSASTEGYMYNQAAAANGDELKFEKVYFPSGTYTLVVRYANGNNQAIIKFYVDTTLARTLDCYHAAGSANQYDKTTGIAISTAGYYDIRMVVDGKNASSGGYRCNVYSMTFYKTA